MNANFAAQWDFTGVVLAGGKSTRMGTDKAALVLQNKTLLHRASELLKEAGAKHILVSRNAPAAAHTSSSDWAHSYVKDVYPNSGPLGGIYSTLLASEHDLLITAVDMPLLTRSILNTLVDAAQRTRAENRHQPLNLLQPQAWHFENEPLPLYIRNTDSVKNHLKQILTNPNSGKSINQFTHSIGVQTLRCNTADALINTNTPAQFKAVNQHCEQSNYQIRRAL